MIYEMYSVKDIKVGFMSPFMQHGESEAIRSFAAAISDPDCTWSKFSNDMELWYVGRWNSETGLIETNGPKFIVATRDMKEKT